MADRDWADLETLMARIREQANQGNLRLTVHAQREMVEEDIKLSDIYRTINTGKILENYPEHRRGACCLFGGRDNQGRNIHIVCTTAHPLLIIITAYIPLPPKWITPTQRGSST